MLALNGMCAPMVPVACTSFGPVPALPLTVTVAPSTVTPTGPT
jgi:hypothetical protein